MSSRPSMFALTGGGPVRLYNTEELLRMPPPSWLIDGILPRGGVAGAYGVPGCGKSFWAIDIAMSVAAGVAWEGHGVESAEYVLYISAEGGSGIGKRAHAWLRHHQMTAKQVRLAWMLEAIPVYLGSEQVEALIQRIADEVRQVPTLVVIDTLARCFDGDENGQEDMGRFIAGVDALRQLWDCTVLIIHHTRLAGDRERGNTAFRGAADTMISVESWAPTGARGAAIKGLKLSCTKQKDAEEFATIKLKLISVEGTESCVCVPALEKDKVAKDASDREHKLLEVLDAATAGQDDDSDEGLSFDEWLGFTELPKASFYRTLLKLQRSGLIAKTSGHRWVRTLGGETED